MRVDQCEVWITCDEHRLPEYHLTPEGEDGKCYSCFIPSESGKKFAVNWRNTSPHGLDFNVVLDGHQPGWGNFCGSNVEGKMWRASPILFVELIHGHGNPFDNMNLDTDEASQAPEIKHLGTICIDVWRMQSICKLRTSSEMQRPESYNVNFPSSRLVLHERSKKAGEHCITLGEAMEIAPPLVWPYQWSFQTIEPERGPIVRFIFRYRSLSLLQAQGVAPLPEKLPVESNRQRSSLPLESSQHSQTADSQAEDARPFKRRRVGDEVDVKPVMEGLSDSDDDEDELNTLKGQLSQMMEKITRMEQKKKKRKDRHAGPRRKGAKVELGASESSPQLETNVIDLTLSD